jgi:beta-galactosidase/beta-glucuronidase
MGGQYHDGGSARAKHKDRSRMCAALHVVGPSLLIVALGVGVIRADSPAQVREALDLGGTWQATLDAGNKGEQEGWFKPEFAASDWRQVPVPGSFANVAPEIDRYEGPGWFRRSFRVPAAWQGRYVGVHFEGVNHTCKVWVNGRLVGENPDAFLGFALPVRAALHFGRDNVIVVRADNSRRRDMIPGGRLGWHPFGGILREVELRATDRGRIESVKVTAEPRGADSALRLRVTLANGYDQQRTFRLEAAVLDQKGAECTRIALGPVAVNAGKQEAVEEDKSIPGIQGWSPAQPTLYTAQVRLLSDDRVLDQVNVRFGFRKIEARGERLYLNGRPVFLTGFNRHEDSPRTDMSPDHELTRKELLMMKEMGCNFIRLCHYPQHPRTIELCDEIGLLVMCEIPLYMWPGLEEGLENYRGTVESARRQLTKLIDRDYNHPSVIFWSVSNEIHTQYPEVRGTNVMLVQQARYLDPTRLAVHVSDHWQQGRPRADSFGADDVICLNAYPNPKDGPGWWSTRLEELHREYPGKPILVTEFGGEADREIEWQIGRLRAGFAGTTAPYVCGVTIWCWADHPWDKTWLEPPLSPYGVFSRDRQPRPSVAVAKEGFLARQQWFSNQTK